MSTTESDTGYVAEDGWKFDSEVTRVFDDMLARSIPQYKVMRETTLDLALTFAPIRSGKDVPTIVDVGCSRGEAMRPLLDKIGAHGRFIGLETSQPMLEAARGSFDGWIKAGVVDIRERDLRKGMPGDLTGRAQVILCVLTLQFTPIEYRMGIVQSMYDSLAPGGALLLVEKVLGSTHLIDKTFNETYWDLKRLNGYSAEEVERKRLSLEGVLVPVTAGMNVEFLKAAGFKSVDCYWRWCNFGGWVAVK